MTRRMLQQALLGSKKGCFRCMQCFTWVYRRATQVTGPFWSCRIVRQLFRATGSSVSIDSTIFCIRLNPVDHLCSLRKPIEINDERVAWLKNVTRSQDEVYDFFKKSMQVWDVQNEVSPSKPSVWGLGIVWPYLNFGCSRLWQSE